MGNFGTNPKVGPSFFSVKPCILLSSYISHVRSPAFISLQNFNHRHNSIDDQFNDFFWRLDGCVDRHAPVKKLKPKEVKLKTKPWINDQIMKMIKIRNKLFACKKRQPNNANITKLYNLFRNRINREIKQSKKIYYNNYFNRYSSDMKKMWKGIRSIVNI